MDFGEIWDRIGPIKVEYFCGCGNEPKVSIK
jgi:hypothetical protein